MMYVLFGYNYEYFFLLHIVARVTQLVILIFLDFCVICFKFILSCSEHSTRSIIML